MTLDWLMLGWLAFDAAWCLLDIAWWLIADRRRAYVSI